MAQKKITDEQLQEELNAGTKIIDISRKFVLYVFLVAEFFSCELLNSIFLNSISEMNPFYIVSFWQICNCFYYQVNTF